MNKIIPDLQKEIHGYAVNQGFYTMETTMRFHTPNPDEHAFFTNLMIIKRLALIHSEVSEALEGLRNNKNNLSEELADVVIRALDLAEFCNIDLSEAINDKMKINNKRPFLHGKEF